MKQTAVEWLFENSHIVPKTELNKRKLIEKAKPMEKQQIIDARVEAPLLNTESKYDYVIEAEQYYNEQFKNK